MEQNVLQALVAKGELDFATIDQLINQVSGGVISREQFAGILSILSARGEYPEEIAGFAASMRKHMKTVTHYGDAIDLCGTGGDGHNTFNISTASMFVVAGAGMRVAKHGNRSASSQSGSADVLEALGARLEYDVQSVAKEGDAQCIFMFAPQFHPVMKQIAPVRKALGIATIFNLLGPLLNPAHVEYQMIGTPSEEKARRIAGAVNALSQQRVGVIHNSDGLDELSTTCSNVVYVVEGGDINKQVVDAAEYGLSRVSIKQLKGGSAKKNAVTLRRLLLGETGPLRDIVILNAGYALYIARKVTDPRRGIELAKKSIDSGEAYKELQRFVRSTGGVYDPKN